jgi:hypothetical protein
MNEDKIDNVLVCVCLGIILLWTFTIITCTLISQF